jgi:hypothetical protein
VLAGRVAKEIKREGEGGGGTIQIPSFIVASSTSSFFAGERARGRYDKLNYIQPILLFRCYSKREGREGDRGGRSIAVVSEVEIDNGGLE